MTEDKDLIALNELVDQAIKTEKQLEVQSKELAESNKQFAEFLKAQKYNEEALKALKDLIRDKMDEMGLDKHETEYVKITLSSSGKFTLSEGVEIDSIPDNLCDIKKVLNNKKIKSYLELNNSLPDGVKATSKVLRMKVK